MPYEFKSPTVITSYGRLGDDDRNNVEEIIRGVVKAMKWTEDEVFVDTQVLEKLGYPKGRTPGNEWMEVYQQAQTVAKYFFFAITPSWNASEFCKQEMEWFLKIRRERDAKGEKSQVIIFLDPGNGGCKNLYLTKISLKSTSRC